MDTVVNADISDLFFNRDLSGCKLYDGLAGGRRVFTGWNEDMLLQEANDTLESLRRLGVFNLPTAAELVEDFHGRI